jgi:uncharacterized protein with GYD domain
MVTFINLLRFTQKGADDLKESPTRIRALKQGIQALGAELKQMYFLMGRYDALVILEAPDDETAFKSILAAFASAGISSETLRAFSEAEFLKIAAALT